MSIVILLLLILLNAYFSLAEIGLVAVTQGQLTTEMNRGNLRAAKALQLIRNPEEFLSVVQVGITLLGILEGIYGGKMVGEMLSPVLQKIPGVTAAAAEAGGMLIGIGAITYLTIVVGELLPKSVALQIPLKVAVWVAPTLLFFAKLAFPFVKLLTYSTRFLLEKLKIQKPEQAKITESDIKKMLSVAFHQGLLNKEELFIHQNVFFFDQMTASRIMKPASITRTLSTAYILSQVIEYIKMRPYSNFPVYNDQNAIVGVINTKELLLNADKDWHLLIRPASLLSPSMKAGDIFLKFRVSEHDFGVVLNDEKTFLGIVTMQDIMEGVFGDLPERDNYEKYFYKQSDGSWIAYGFVHLQRIRRVLSLEWMREYESGLMTVSELLVSELHHEPQAGERLSLHNLVFTVLEATPREVGKVKIEIQSADPVTIKLE